MNIKNNPLYDALCPDFGYACCLDTQLLSWHIEVYLVVCVNFAFHVIIINRFM